MPPKFKYTFSNDHFPTFCCIVRKKVKSARNENQVYGHLINYVLIELITKFSQDRNTKNKIRILLLEHRAPGWLFQSAPSQSKTFSHVISFNESW